MHAPSSNDSSSSTHISPTPLSKSIRSKCQPSYLQDYLCYFAIGTSPTPSSSKPLDDHHSSGNPVFSLSSYLSYDHLLSQNLLACLFLHTLSPDSIIKLPRSLIGVMP
jgi:hypothetical protein